MNALAPTGKSAGALPTQGRVELIDKIINIDQSPIYLADAGPTWRFTDGNLRCHPPATSQTSEAKVRGYKAGRFSFNSVARSLWAMVSSASEMNLPATPMPCVFHGGASLQSGNKPNTGRADHRRPQHDRRTDACNFFENQPRIVKIAPPAGRFNISVWASRRHSAVQKWRSPACQIMATESSKRSTPADAVRIPMQN